MKKIGIVTIYDDHNYGNRLQNLAVQNILKNRGFDVRTLVCRQSRLKEFLHPLWMIVRQLQKKTRYGYRIISFIHFNRKYIAAEYCYDKSYRISTKIKEKYDYFVAGSDQVWNYKYQSEQMMSMYLLEFADDCQKICISPSIGVSEIDKEHRETFCNALKGFKFLSCREANGAEELSRVTGRECICLIDPTLFVTESEWRSYFSITTEKSESYLFVFFIDGISEELKQFIQSFALDKYKIIDISDSNSSLFVIDPEKFISLLANAYMVFTDSFHVTAFAINFHVPFYVFNRGKIKNMTSRIETICHTFGLEDRYICEQGPFAIQENCSFEIADVQLRKERRKFSEYLDNCFKS